MADEKPTLHIDTDWKKQAQEEKRKLAEQEKAKAQQQAAAPPAGVVGPSSTTGAPPSGAAGARRPGAGGASGEGREMPPPSFGALVQSIMTQVLFYLGDLTPRGAAPQLNLDLAKHHIDILGILEDKTRNNLADEEKHLLDAALYETRMRYVNVASQFIS